LDSLKKEHHLQTETLRQETTQHRNTQQKWKEEHTKLSQDYETIIATLRHKLEATQHTREATEKELRAVTQIRQRLIAENTELKQSGRVLQDRCRDLILKNEDGSQKLSEFMRMNREIQQEKRDLQHKLEQVMKDGLLPRKELEMYVDL
jgi:uncharacterized protein YukE